MKENQIEGDEGRANNVGTGNKDSEPAITSHDFGRGINTEVAMQKLDSNRAMYERDQFIEKAHGQMEEPDQYAEKVSKPGFV